VSFSTVGRYLRHHVRCAHANLAEPDPRPLGAQVTVLLVAAIFLPLSHFGISSSPLRATLVGRIGERPYQGLYSLVSFAAFALLIVAYRHAEAHLLWVSPALVKLAALPLVLLAFLLVVVGLTTPNPTTLGAEALLDRPNVARGILRITRNPFLWGTALWAFAHIAATGELASLLFFGSIGALGLLGAFLLDAKKARQHGHRWQRFAAETSNLPFHAILEGRQHLVLGEIGAWRLALAIVLFGIVLVAHPRLFGVSPL
jgi:uncharacterized membrane protein